MISFCAKRCLFKHSLSITLKQCINMSNHCHSHLTYFKNIVGGNQKFYLQYRCFADDSKSKELPNELCLNENLSDVISSIKTEATKNYIVSMEALIKAVSLMEHHDFSTDDSVNLIKCCGVLVPKENAQEKLEIARKIIKLAIEKNVIDVNHYNTFLDIIKENECNIAAEEFLQSMIKHVEPNITTYVKLLQCVCSSGDVRQSTVIISEMKKLNYPISEDVFNALVLGHGRAGDIANARAVVDTMLTMQMLPSEKTYSALLLGFAGSSEPYHILQSLREANSKQIKFESKSLFEIAYQLAMAGHDKYIPNVLLELQHAPSFSLVKAFCIRLIHKGAPKSAYTVLVELVKPDTTSTSDAQAYGSFLITELILADTDVSTIIDICEDLMMSGRNMYALHAAYITAVKCGGSSALSLLNEMQKQGIEIRPHYFWPLIVSVGDHSGDSGVMGVLRAMQNLKVTPDFETLRNYALPRLDMRNPVVVVRKLQDLRLTVSEILQPLVSHLLMKNRLKDCVTLVRTFKKSELDGDIIIKQLVKSVVNGADAKDVVVIVKAIKAVKTSNDDTTTKIYSDWPGLLALEVISSDEKKKCPKNLHSLIISYKTDGLKLSSFATDIIADYYSKSDYKPDNLELLLNELRSTEFAISSSELFSQFIPHPRDMDMDELENHFLELKSKKMNTRGVLRRLLQGHIRKGNLKRALEILAECVNQRIIFSPGMLASILELHIKTENVEDAEMTFKNLRRQAPWFKLDEHKMIDYSTFLIKKGYLQASIDILKQYCLDHNVKGGESISRNCFRLLTALSETGTPDEVRAYLEELVELRFCTKNNILLGPVIRAHLNRNDFEGAVQDFVTSVHENNCTPLQLELITHLAKRNETELLQRTLDACKKVHGVVSTLSLLAIAYATANKTSELRRLLTDPTSRISSIHLRKRCERLETEGNYQPLEVLANVCKDLPQFIPDNIYERILRIHCRQNNSEAVLELYNKLLENDEKPSVEFLYTLTNFLQSNRLPLPQELVDSEKPQVSLETKLNT